MRFVQSSRAKVFSGADLASDSRTLLVNGASVTSTKTVPFDGGAVKASALVGRMVSIGGTVTRVTANTTSQLTVEDQKWYAEGEQLKADYPDFDLGTEARNPQFLSMLKSGVPVKLAYEVLHMDGIKAVVAQAAAQRTEKQVVDGIRAKGARPPENGTAAQSGFTVKDDVSKLTKKDRAEIARRAARGERITF